MSIALEQLDLEAIVEIGETARIRLRDGRLLPGQVFVDAYRAVKYGFVMAAGMEGVTFKGKPADGRLQEPRIVDAVARASGWRLDQNGEVVQPDFAWRNLKRMEIPPLDEALADLRERKICIQGA